MGHSQRLGSRHELLSAQRQKQKLSPTVLQGVELLTMPLLAMRGYLSEASLGNPLLELVPPPEDPWPEPPGREGGAEEDPESHQPPVRRREHLEASARDPDDLFNLRGTQFELDTLAGSLELQLSLCKLSPVEEAIGRAIIGDLDARGYFAGSLPTICCYHQVPQEAGLRVLKLIQGFSPRGIAARDVYECLCLQVEEDCPHPDTARRIIREDLERLAAGQTALCARKYRLEEADIQAIFQYIRGLDPRPGNCDSRPQAVCYTVPDLIVRRGDDGFQVHICGEEDQPLRLSRDYLDMLARGGLTAEETDYLRARLGEAKALIKSVSIRHQTLRSFALALLRLQPDFFLEGAGRLRPMTMQAMAGEMGVSVSTVSRVVQGKYMDTPWGVYPLRSFFTGACGTAGGGAVSVRQIKDRILALARGADPAGPLNDTQICARLQAEGYQISRRTVTKYRQSLGLAGQGTRTNRE